MSGAVGRAAAPRGTVRLWLLAARPRTLPAAVAPVLVGTSLAATQDDFSVLPFVAALVGSVFIQIGTNLSNDYSDARRGADTEERLAVIRDVLARVRELVDAGALACAPCRELV